MKLEIHGQLEVQESSSSLRAPVEQPLFRRLGRLDYHKLKVLAKINQREMERD